MAHSLQYLGAGAAAGAEAGDPLGLDPADDPDLVQHGARARVRAAGDGDAHLDGHILAEEPLVQLLCKPDGIDHPELAPLLPRASDDVHHLVPLRPEGGPVLRERFGDPDQVLRVHVGYLDRLPAGEMGEAAPVPLRDGGEATHLLDREVSRGHTHPDSAEIDIPLGDHPAPEMDAIVGSHCKGGCTPIG